MFALLINKCDASKREFVIEVALNFITFGSDDLFRYTLACSDAQWVLHGSESVRPASKRVDALNALLEATVCEGRCFLGSNRRDASITRCEGNCVEIVHKTNAVVIDTLADEPATMLLAMRRSHQAPLWMGWYREEGIDIVFVHVLRKAMMAATGCCGCLFDKKLQLWLVEARTSALYQLGTHKVRVTSVNGSEEETDGAGSRR